MGFNYNMVWQMEQFPQQIKATAMQATFMWQYVSTIMIPHIETFLESTKIPALAFFAFLCLVITAGAAFLPETVGQPQQELIR